jgi:hypothetical protein
MSDVKMRHYVVKRGKGFWQPTAKMKTLGFGSVPCGPDGPGAWAIAEGWNRRWDQTRSGEMPCPAMASAQNLTFENSEELTIYPPRSLGEAFYRYRRTEEWKRKAPRTREDWWRGWKRIKPIFGDCDPRTGRLTICRRGASSLRIPFRFAKLIVHSRYGERCGRSRRLTATASEMPTPPSPSATRQRQVGQRGGLRGMLSGWRSVRGG